MKNTKIIALLLALATVLSAASFGAFADDISFEYLYDADAITETGDHSITPLDTVDVTGYCFTPSEAGVYKISVKTEGAVLHTLIGSSFFAMYGAAAEDNTITFEVKESSLGSSCLFGLQYSGTAVVNITLEDEEVSVDPADLPWETYENTSTPTAFTLSLEEGQQLVYVSVYESHTAVLGEDGFYHLDSVDGPILYVNLGLNAPYLSLGDATNYGTVRNYFYDENGNFIKKVDYNSAVVSYFNRSDNGIYPLTYDLMHIYQTHGTAKGWYDADDSLNRCIFTNTEGLVEENAWMFACAYVPAEEDGDESSESAVSSEDSSEELSSDESSEESSEELSSEESSEESEPVTGYINYALGKPYTISKNLLTSDPAQIFLPDTNDYNSYEKWGDLDFTRLTDGRTAAGWELNSLGALEGVTVSLTGTNAIYEFVIDLGETKPDISKVVFRGVRDGAANGNNRGFSVNLTMIYTSDILGSWDSRLDTTFSKEMIQDAPYISNQTQEGVEAVENFTYTFTLNTAASGRYVRILATSPVYLLQFDEIEVWGMGDGEESSEESFEEELSSEESAEDLPSDESSEESREDLSSEVSDESSEETEEDSSQSSCEDSESENSSDETADLVCGDINGDGAVNSLDAAQALRSDAQLITLEDTALIAADVNGDGAVNSLDAAQILKFDAGLITEF